MQAREVVHLLAGLKTSSLHAGRAHHRIHRQLRVSAEEPVDLVKFINNKVPRRSWVSIAYLLGLVGAKLAYRLAQGELEQVATQ